MRALEINVPELIEAYIFTSWLFDIASKCSLLVMINRVTYSRYFNGFFYLEPLNCHPKPVQKHAYAKIKTAPTTIRKRKIAVIQTFPTKVECFAISSSNFSIICHAILFLGYPNPTQSCPNVTQNWPKRDLISSYFEKS